MAAIVVDACVVLKWVVEEEGSAAAVALAGQELWAPELLRAECANALWAKARRGELDTADVIERNEILTSAPVNLVASREILTKAVSLALELEHPVYDCLYLALAIEKDAQLVTADRRFLRVVQGSSYRARARALGATPV